MAPSSRILSFGLALALMVVSLHAAPLHRSHSHDIPFPGLHNHRRHLMLPRDTDEVPPLDHLPVKSPANLARDSAGVPSIDHLPVKVSTSRRQVATSNRFPVGPMAEPGFAPFGIRFVDDAGL